MLIVSYSVSSFISCKYVVFMNKLFVGFICKRGLINLKFDLCLNHYWLEVRNIEIYYRNFVEPWKCDFIHFYPFIKSNKWCKKLPKSFSCLPHWTTFVQVWEARGWELLERNGVRNVLFILNDAQPQPYTDSRTFWVNFKSIVMFVKCLNLN